MLTKISGADENDNFCANGLFLALLDTLVDGKSCLFPEPND